MRVVGEKEDAEERKERKRMGESFMRDKERKKEGKKEKCILYTIGCQAMKGWMMMREIDREREKSRPASTCRETDGEGQGISLALDCLDISQLSLCVQS